MKALWIRENRFIPSYPSTVVIGWNVDRAIGPPYERLLSPASNGYKRMRQRLDAQRV